MSSVERLFKQCKPDHYDIKLEMSADLSFQGSVLITATIVSTQAIVRLHAKALTINKVYINTVITKFSTQDDELQIQIPESINQSKLDIKIDYSGTVTEAMHGIYPSHTNQDSLLLATQFESHHAREAFPCIDEPEAKATFALTLSAPMPTILSNMPAKHTQRTGEITTCIFETTPRMSTYLLAFVAGDLQHVATTTENGTEIRVWSTKDHAIDSLVFPLEVAVKATEYLNDYFDIPYPLSKCDHVAIPDFSSGAMENWGLITYRELALLSDPSTTSTSAKEFVATVIVHEIAHQWFGNLVTMRWWDDLWLNESFANLMEYLVIDALYPDWNIMLNFAANEALSAFRRDILPGVQPVSTAVNNPGEINALFDPAIVYAKGSRLLYMVYKLVGDRNFKKGLHNYFSSYAYKNTVGQNLWDALSETSGIDIGSIMKPWIEQSGFPYIEVTTSDMAIQLKQQQLTSDGSLSDRLWPIPLWPASQQRYPLFETRTTNLQYEDKPVQLNSIGGHYVTYYKSGHTRRSLFAAAKHNKIPADSRLLLLHDALLLARCNVTSMIIALEALPYYANELEESVWAVIGLVIADTKMLVEGDVIAEKALRKYCLAMIQPALQTLGFLDSEDDSSNDRKLRSIITSLAVYTDDDAIMQDVLNIYRQSTSLERLPANSRHSILVAVAKRGSISEYMNLLSLYPSISNNDIQLDVAGALSAAQSSKRLQCIIEKLIDDSFIRKQDVSRIVFYLLKNQYSRQMTWEWLVANWGWIEDSFGNDMSFESYSRYSAAVFASDKWLSAYKQHFTPLLENPALQRSIELGIQDIQTKISWKQKDKKNVIEWLKAQS